MVVGSVVGNGRAIVVGVVVKSTTAVTNFPVGGFKMDFGGCVVTIFGFGLG